MVGVSVMLLHNPHIVGIQLHYYAILVHGLEINLSENVRFMEGTMGGLKGGLHTTRNKYQFRGMVSSVVYAHNQHSKQLSAGVLSIQFRG